MSNVEHPQHYQRDGRKECIDEMVDLYGIDNTAVFCLLNAYKYLYRAGYKSKDTYTEDIEKARYYFNWCKNKMKDLVLMWIGNEKLYADIERMLADYD